jgi:hypothetical protein
MTEKQFFNSLTESTRVLLGIQSVILSSGKNAVQIAEFLDISINGAKLILEQLNLNAEFVDTLYRYNVCDGCD